MMRDRVLIWGAGQMGSTIAVAALAAENKVTLYSRGGERDQRLWQLIEQHLLSLKGYGLCPDQVLKGLSDRLQILHDPVQAAADARLVIEAVSEDLSVKQEVFHQLDALLPSDIPLLSNTSGLRITDIAQRMAHPERALTAHFWLPAHLIPLVEIVVGERSSPMLAAQVKAELERWGKAPIIVKRDLQGQLANRILQAVIREAVHIVDIGLASPEDVDTAVQMGMGLRFPVWGPLQHVDAVGLDICAAVQDSVLPGISASPAASEGFRERLSRGETGFKSLQGFYSWDEPGIQALVARRDRFLLETMRLLRQLKDD